MNHNLEDILIPLARKFGGNRISLPHIMGFIKYNSYKKVANLIKVLWEVKTSKIEVKSRPFILFLEVNNVCNLHCPFCLTGKRKSGGRPIRNMSFDEMKRIIEPVEDVLYFIQLYNWGEPLINKDLFKFVEYARSKKIFTMASSNMNFTRPNLPEQIIDSGLDYFIAAIDGFSPQTYSLYRRGGDFIKAKKNLEAILELKKANKAKTPYVEWQYVVFKHNQHEIEAAREFANDIGVDFFHPIKGYIENPDWITDLPEYQTDVGQSQSVFNCTRPWTHLNIRVDGGVAPCCYEYYKKDDFGNIFNSSFTEIWNNSMFKSARQLITKGVNTITSEKTICHRCIATGKRPSFEKVDEK